MRCAHETARRPHTHTPAPSRLPCRIHVSACAAPRLTCVCRARRPPPPLAPSQPAVSCIDLFDLTAQLSQVTLVLASDGLWDVWSYKDVLKYPLRATAPDARGEPPQSPLGVGVVGEQLKELISETRRESFEMFGESADNITAICVAFDKIQIAE